MALVLCTLSTLAFASAWQVPGGNRSDYDDGSAWSGISVRLIDDLATRSGPSTQYTGCGSYKMKGSYVNALSRAYDNGGVLWIEIEFQYGGGYRRAWTGAKRLDISKSQLQQLPEADNSYFLGYGTITQRVSPRYGPGDIYSSYSDRDFRRGDQVAVIEEAYGYYLVERYHTDGNILRSWVDSYYVSFN